MATWWRAPWQQAPATVRFCAAVLVLTALAIPLVVLVPVLRDPEGVVPSGVSTTPVLVALVAVLLVAAGLLLLAAWLLLRRSRVAWLFVVGSGLSVLVVPGEPAPLLAELLGYALTLATFVPLLTPGTVRWFWQRPRPRRAPAYSATTDLRRPD